MPADLRSHVFAALLNVWGLISLWWPYLVGGIIAASLLDTFVPRSKWARILSAKNWRMLPAAALAGMASPGCTHGAAAILAETVKAGARLDIAAAFLVASSILNPQVFLLMAGLLGIRFAAVQAVATLVFAVAAGSLVSLLSERGVDIMNPALSEMHTEEARRSRHKHTPNGQRSWPKRLLETLLDLTEFVGFYFLIGVTAAAFIAEFVPQSTVVAAAGQGKWWAVPCAAVVSIPAYICGGGMIPLLAVASGKGMAAGAVIAFLIAGPATRMTALSALAIIFRKRAVFAYVLLVLAFSILIGVLIGGYLQLAADAGTPTEMPL